MQSFKDFIQNEMAARKSTKRLLQAANDPPRLTIAITAHRGEQEVFPGAMKSLQKELQNLGLGTTPTTGGYQEGDVRVDEPSLIASTNNPPENTRELVKKIIELAEKYQQMGVIIKLPGEEAFEYTTKYHENPGKRIPYGTATRQKEPAYYTRPRYRNREKHGTDGISFNPSFDKAHPYES